MENIVIIGQGSIGSALKKTLHDQYPNATIRTLSRQAPLIPDPQHQVIDYLDETQLANTAHELKEVDLILVTTGILHDQYVKPEKSIKELSTFNFQHLFEINTIIPAILAKHFIPIMARSKPSVMAFLSARVGSISDNALGGWYAYRASKTALNMIIKNFSIETKRMHPNKIIVGLHPGTVDSPYPNLFKPI